MGRGRGRGKFKGKPTGMRQFSIEEETGMRQFSIEEETLKHEETESEEEHSGEESEEEPCEVRRKGIQGLIEVENPNWGKPKVLKVVDIDIEKTTELSRREREEIEKQKRHERYTKLQEQGKTEQARMDLERLALIRQQRAEAANKREEEKAMKEQKKVEARKGVKERKNVEVPKRL